MIAYYAHSEGSGHSRYASIWYGLFSEHLEIMSSTPKNFSSDIKIFKLAKEDPDGTGLPLSQTGVPDYLHYSPVGQRSIQRRSLQILTSLVKAECKLAIIDVSVEVAALARAASIPFAYVKLPGLRNDSAHLNAFKASLFNLAYYPKEFEHPSTPQWVIDKTLYLGYFSRFSFTNQATFKIPNSINRILIIRGQGSSSKLIENLAAIADRFMGSQVQALGDFSDLEKPINNINFLGFKSNIETYIKSSDLIIASTGLNLTSEILSSGKLFCCVPEDRPFDEQKETAKNLRQHKLAFNIEDVLFLSNEELRKQIKPYNSEISANKVKMFIEWLENTHCDISKLFASFSIFKKKLEQAK